MKVAIVGGGIMGLCAAWALTARGAEVELFEQGPLPNDMGPSADRHRAIRYPYGPQRGYQGLVTDAYAAWGRLFDGIGERHYVETGTLVLFSSAAGRPDWALASLDGLNAAGLPVERLSPYDIAERFPVLSAEGLDGGFVQPQGGALLADLIVGALTALLPRRGATLHPYTPVETVDPETCTVEIDVRWRVKADALIVAAGPWTGKLLPDHAAERIVPTRNVVVYLEPPLDLAVAWSRMPLILSDEGAGTGFYLLPPVAGHGMKIGDMGTGTPFDPDEPRHTPTAEAQRVFELGAGRFQDFRRYRRGEARTCYYDMADGERFIVEPIAAHGRSLMMTGFSGHGFKFGALMGEAVADALTGRRDPAGLTAWAAGLGGAA